MQSPRLVELTMARSSPDRHLPLVEYQGHTWAIVGVEVGLSVGLDVGLTMGLTVGDTVGSIVGSFVGYCDGTTLGIGVGQL